MTRKIKRHVSKNKFRREMPAMKKQWVLIRIILPPWSMACRRRQVKVLVLTALWCSWRTRPPFVTLFFFHTSGPRINLIVIRPNLKQNYTEKTYIAIWMVYQSSLLKSEKKTGIHLLNLIDFSCRSYGWGYGTYCCFGGNDRLYRRIPGKNSWN